MMGDLNPVDPIWLISWSWAARFPSLLITTTYYLQLEYKFGCSAGGDDIMTFCKNGSGETDLLLFDKIVGYGLYQLF